MAAICWSGGILGPIFFLNGKYNALLVNAGQSYMSAPAHESLHEFASGHAIIHCGDQNWRQVLVISHIGTELSKVRFMLTRLSPLKHRRPKLDALSIQFRHFCAFIETLSQVLGHDELNLPIPTSIRDICFLPVDEKLNCCVTKEGMVLLYDERAQRRPVVKFIEPKASYTVISPAYRERQCLVGTTKGYLQLIDLRMPPKCVKTFTTFTGSITGIACCPSEPVVATTCLDRFLRVHNLDTKELLHKEYLKQSLTGILMKPVVKEEKDSTTIENEESECIDEEYEALFNSMETISDNVKPQLKPKKKKRKSVIVENIVATKCKKSRKRE